MQAAELPLPQIRLKPLRPPSGWDIFNLALQIAVILAFFAFGFWRRSSLLAQLDLLQTVTFLSVVAPWIRVESLRTASREVGAVIPTATTVRRRASNEIGMLLILFGIAYFALENRRVPELMWPALAAMLLIMAGTFRLVLRNRRTFLSFDHEALRIGPRSIPWSNIRSVALGETPWWGTLDIAITLKLVDAPRARKDCRTGQLGADVVIYPLQFKTGPKTLAESIRHYARAAGAAVE